MHSSDLIGSFEEREFPAFRYPTIDVLTWGRKRHHIPILLEMDVTVARQTIQAQKTMGRSISFTGWLVKCIAQAVSDHKSVHALRRGHRRLVVFDEVDVTLIVERAVGHPQTPETLPMPYIIRNANGKGVVDITAEIRTAKHATVAAGAVQLGSPHAAWVGRMAALLPRFMRDLLVWQPLFRDPFRFKRWVGTVSVTAMGMVSQGGMSWGIPIGIHPLIVAVGAIAQRPGVVQGQIVIREYVGLTVLFDHDVVDGAPVARFIRRLQTLMADAYALEDG